MASMRYTTKHASDACELYPNKYGRLLSIQHTVHYYEYRWRKRNESVLGVVS